ncbi:MAG: Ig-like domain-containing protein, partial [Propionibacteriaceae bacterium]|nr:Ig-like domain-containing protein [Propionibacteriaceae bacterium]
MRKPVAASAAGCLLAALIAIPPPVAAADPVPGEYLNQPLARLISQSNGTTGWAATNAANLSAQGYDPASVGRAYAPQAGHDHVTTSIAADGKSATVKVSECCGEWEVGSVLADADGTATVALQNEFTTDPDEFLLTFDESTPDLVTVDMLVESLLPIITFTVVVREKDGDQPDPDKDKLSTWGHYALNLVDGTIEDDDSTTRTPPNGHSTYRALGNPQVLSRRLKKSTVFAQAVADIKATAMTQAAADVSKGIQTLLEGYANTMRWAQEIDVPYSFGYAPAGLGNGDEATFTVQGAAAQDSWLSDLSTRVEDVPVSFQSTDLSGLVTDRMAQATAGTSLGSALAQLGEGLSYPKFAAGIDCWATPNCAPEGVPSLEDTIQWAMIDEYKKGIQAGLEQASRIQWDLGAVDDEGQPEDSDYYAIVTFDNILGETTFSGRGMNSLSPFNFYPAAKFDARLAKQIADFIRSSTGLGQPWAPVIEEHLSGTADLVATFDPGRITRVYPTGVDDSTGLAPIAPLSLSTLDSVALAPSMANLRPGATATYTFTSDDPRIASVDGSGVVRAVAEGATTIQVRASVSCPQETRPVTYDLWVDVSV